jgi:peptide-methionine (S)-S-oxide reductase
MDVMKLNFVLCLLLSGAAAGYAQKMNTPASDKRTNGTELATLGGGCFWCIEAIFERLDGVKSVTSGYTGGQTDQPTYEDVCTGLTGHAEVAQIEYDAQKISYDKLLEVFWEAHDPTTLNRQGADVGTQYRSAIFYHNDAQRQAAEKSKAEAAKQFDRPIVTEIKPLTKFHKAENYHQDYFRNHSNAPYCNYVIKPKLEKLRKKLGKQQSQ